MSPRLLRYVLEAIPAHDYWLDLGARMPPALRTRSSLRLLSALARRQMSSGDLVTTNLGISQSLKIQVRPAHLHARFGKPSLYDGERGALELACVLAPHSDAFLDIGAHIGFFTWCVRTLASPTVPIYFFEPDPDLFKLLQANVEMNHLDGVVGVPAAIGGRDGMARFYCNLSDSFSGSLGNGFQHQHQHEVAPIDVEVRSFASFGRQYGFERATVKVDVENAEWDFLDGAAGAFERIAYLIMEVLRPAHERRFVPELMKHSGLKAYYINDYRLEHSEDGSFNYRSPEYNWLFCRETPGELAERVRGTRLRVA